MFQARRLAKATAIPNKKEFKAAQQCANSVILPKKLSQATKCIQQTFQLCAEDFNNAKTIKTALNNEIYHTNLN